MHPTLRPLLASLTVALLAGCAGSWDQASSTSPTGGDATMTSPTTTSRSSTTTPAGAPPPPPPPGEPSFVAVTIAGGAYDPADITVTAGSKVTWSNRDGGRHTVTSDGSGGPLAGSLGPAEQYQHTFATPGTYAYHCEFHAGMAGKVTVTGS